MIIQKARSFPNYTPATLMPSPTISQSRSNAYQNLSKLCQNLFLPSCFRIILFLFILLPHCIIVGVVFFNMQTSFSQNMHTLTDWHTARQSLGNSSYTFSRLDLDTTPLRLWSLIFLSSISSWIFYLHPTGCAFFFLLAISLSCKYYVSLHSHFSSPWAADFSFNSCLWPAS